MLLNKTTFEADSFVKFIHSHELVASWLAPRTPLAYFDTIFENNVLHYQAKFLFKICP
jgi:hypothetical protein